MASFCCLVHRSTHPRGSHSGGPIEGPPGGLLLLPLAQVFSSQGQPFWRAHWRTSRWPPPAAPGTGLLIPGAAILAGPLKHLQVASSCCTWHRCTHPRGSHSGGPIGGPPGGLLLLPCNRLLIPGAAIRTGPLQQFEVAPCSKHGGEVLSVAL